MAVVIVFSLFLVGMGLYSLMSGTLVMRGKFDKEHSPITYWLGTVFYIVSGIVFLVVMLIKYQRTG